MKKFLKLAIIPIAFLACSNLTSCNISPKEVALITDVGDIDDGSFNQATWEGAKAFCNEHSKSFDYYRPFADSDFARESSVKQAVYKGAKIILMPGYKFSTTARKCSKLYPNVKFLNMDPEVGKFTTETGEYDVPDNLCLVNYKPELSGFLAGYANASDYIVYDIEHDGKPKDEYKYGYMGGMANDGVLQFGFGFIQGIVVGTKAEIDLYNEDPTHTTKFSYPKINVNFEYAHVFSQSDQACADVKGWYSQDVRSVFACGGKLYQSVVEAAKSHNKKHSTKEYEDYISGASDVAPRDCARWVGVDSDQYPGLRDNEDKKLIVTSALKGLTTTVETALGYFYDGNWDIIGGPYRPEQPQWILGLNSNFGKEKTGVTIEPKNYVGLPEVTKEGSDVMRGFYNFTLTKYKGLTDKLNNDLIYSGNGSDIYKDEDCKTTYYSKPEEQRGDPSFYSLDPNNPTANPSYLKVVNNSGSSEDFRLKYYGIFNKSSEITYKDIPYVNVMVKM